MGEGRGLLPPRSEDPGRIPLLATAGEKGWPGQGTEGQAPEPRQEAQQLADLMESEAKLQSQLLDLLEDIQRCTGPAISRRSTK